ncbi:MAG TPA: hypothetical protein VE868_03145 [Balneolaceae bacterium]|nr:hypothetical protein [Balneolaceae bacterium]
MSHGVSIWTKGHQKWFYNIARHAPLKKMVFLTPFFFGHSNPVGRH